MGDEDDKAIRFYESAYDFIRDRMVYTDAEQELVDELLGMIALKIAMLKIVASKFPTEVTP